MDAALLEERAMRLVERMRKRGVMLWIGGGGSILMTPLAAVSATDRAFIAAHSEVVADVLSGLGG